MFVSWALRTVGVDGAPAFPLASSQDCLARSSASPESIVDSGDISSRNPSGPLFSLLPALLLATASPASPPGWPYSGRNKFSTCARQRPLRSEKTQKTRGVKLIAAGLLHVHAYRRPRVEEELIVRAERAVIDEIARRKAQPWRRPVV